MDQTYVANAQCISTAHLIRKLSTGLPLQIPGGTRLRNRPETKGPVGWTIPETGQVGRDGAVEIELKRGKIEWKLHFS